MKSKLISFILALCLLIAIPLEARYKYNPFTRKLDYYETGADIDLGDLADVTLTALASGAVLYYDGSAWVNLPKGLDGQHLGLTLGIPSWETAASPTFLGLTDTPGAYAGKAGQLVRVNAGANALEFFAGSPLGTVIIADGAGGWTKTENYRVSAAGAVTLGSWTATAVANAYVAGINQNLLTTSTPTFDDVTISTPVNIYGLSHNSFADYAANQHVALPNTIASVLSDHNLVVHTALGLFDASSDVDHNLTTNYAANQHVVLPGTIANVLSDHNLLAHTALGLFDASSDVDHDLTTNYVAAQHRNPAKVFYISATGGDYTTIQAALTAQNAGGETFLVGPGTYADTISFTANDQVVKPLGQAANVIVTQADANIVDVGAWTDCIVEGIEIRLTAPTTAINAIQAGTGTLILIECRGYLATAVALAQVDQPALIGFTDAGTIRIKRGNYQYYHTGNAGGTGIKAAFRANQNLAELHLHKVDVIKITNSGTASITALYTTTGTAVTEMHNCVDAIVTDPHATYVVGLGYIGGSGADNVQGNHIVVEATNNTAYGIWHAGTATVRSSFNAFHVSDVAGESYAFNVGVSATLNSHFDDLRSDNGNSVAGTLNMVSSPADGDLAITDELDVIGVSEFSGDTNQYEDVFWTWNEAADHALIIQTAVAGIEDQPLIEIDDQRTGATVDEKREASLVLNADGPVYALFIQDGAFWTDTPSTFAGDMTANEDVFLTWADAADHAVIAQSSGTGVENQALIYLNDDRADETASEAIEATIVIDAAGAYALYIQSGAAQFDVNTIQTEDIFWTWADAADRAIIAQSAVAGTEDRPLIDIDDDRTGVTVDEASEATIYLDADGLYALYIANGVFGVADWIKYDETDFNQTYGYQAGANLSATDALENILIGTQAGYNITTGDKNVAIGYHSGHKNKTGDFNVAIGVEAMQGVTNNSHSQNVAIGYFAMRLVETGSSNVAIGTQAGALLSTGANNVFIGSLAGGATTTASNNMFLGYYAGGDSQGSNNVALGYQAGYRLDGGNSNTNVGYRAGMGQNGFNANYGVHIGYSTGTRLKTASGQVAIGYESGMYNLDAIGNVLIGYQAGKGTADNDYGQNTIIGYQAALNITTGDGNVVIGYMAGEGWLDTESNILVIDNSDTATPLIHGDFTADSIRINGDLEIPDGKLIEFGTDADGSIEYDETTNDALIFGVPIGGKRAIIICDIADIAVDFTGIIPVTGQPKINIVDEDYDSGLSLGFAGDDKPVLMSRGNPLHINYDALQNVYVFEDSTSGENCEFRIYGYDTVTPGVMHGKFYVDAAGKFHVGAQNAPIIFDLAQRVPVNIADFSNPPTDGELDAAFGTPVAVGVGYWSYINDNGAGTNFYHIVSDGASWLTFTPDTQRDMVYWIDCFDHGVGATKYQWSWDITSLNTQGAGTNTIDTTPSEITLTTDNNAIGDNQGTCTEFQIVQRARRNRTQWMVELGQTANTQFYFGWNTSGTNAMVAAADEYVIVFFDVSDNANWQIKVGDGATEDVFTSGIAGAVAHIKHEIWVETDGTVHWLVNGAELDITGSVDNLMTASNHYLIAGQAQSVIGAAVIVVEIDYVENEKTKAH